MTTELKPGTPEYKEAYEAEMARLEAAAKPGEKKPEGDGASTSTQDDGKDKGKDAKPDPVEELRTKLTASEKRLDELSKDLRGTKRSYFRSAERVNALERELIEERKARTKPAILDANPGLEDAIEHVAGPTEKKPAPNGHDAWLGAVATAIPDVDDLLADPAFEAKAKEKQRELGADWDNPFLAIRELSDLRANHLRDKATTAAVEAARKDFEARAKKRPGMEVPGGSGSGSEPSEAERTQAQEAERIRTMPKAEFDKLRSKALGYY